MVFNLISKKKRKQKTEDLIEIDLTDFKEALRIYEKKYNEDRDRTKHIWIHCAEREKYNWLGVYKYKYVKVYCDAKANEFLDNQVHIDGFIDYVKIKADCYLDNEVKGLEIQISDGRKNPYDQVVQTYKYKRSQEQ